MLYFLLGLVGAVVSATPPGPINIKVTNYVLRRETPKLIWFLIGVILADLVVASIAATGVQFIFSEFQFGFWLELIGGLIILGVASVGFKKKHSFKQNSISSSKKGGIDFIVGVSLCLFNPGFLAFWTIALKFLHENRERASLEQLLIFLVAIILGNAIWFSLYAYIIRHIVRNKSDVFLEKLLLVLNLLLFGFGLVLIGKVTLSWFGIDSSLLN